jgi:hypothetical protein
MGKFQSHLVLNLSGDSVKDPWLAALIEDL